MKRTVLALTILIATTLGAWPAGAQSAGECKGDFNLDHAVSVDELIVAVYNSLHGCGPSVDEQGCLDSGGTVSSGLCCSTAPDFPDTCGIGPCGCSPQASREVKLCDCGDGSCFDRDTHACVDRSAR